MPASRPGDAVLRVVLELLESGGHDAVQIREVVRRAHVSPLTIYKLFPSRDELVVAALQQWLTVNSCAPVSPPAPGESLYDGLMRVFRHVFEPWERSPRILEAYHRARNGPGGRKLDQQAMGAIEPVARAILVGGDPDYIDDIGLILTNMAYAVVGQFANGELDITAILPTLERAVFRLTTNNEPAAAAAQTRRTRPDRYPTPPAQLDRQDATGPGKSQR
ncbi:TetR/AcrR family transcriptional regulator, cholesterol catabolism regulator [Frankia sp. Hr75.2]|nr:TetR/AcrR family transcriptional regulator, cholesterol catabolism regulator [Frankia sp. Hr75.2]